MRSRGGGGFGFGGVPSLKSTAARLAAGIVVGSVVWALCPAGLKVALLLLPGAVLSPDLPALWQPLTYVFIATDPVPVLFGALIAYSLGGALEQTWGSRRTLLFALGVTVGAGVLTALLGLVAPSLRDIPFAGATVLTSALWVAFGLSWGRAQTNFWGIPVTGNVLAAIGAGFVFLQVAFRGWRPSVHELFGLGLTWAYLRMESPRMLLLRLQSWRLQRQLRGVRSSSRKRNHLRVVDPSEREPDEGPRRDRYLN
jgi:membrane associated rhomboid family serine protease